MINRAAMGVLGSRPVELAALRVTAHRPRALAYHGVDDVTAFERHLQILQSRYDVVDPEAFLRRAHDGRQRMTGRPAVLITFDDGSPTVIEHALPLLNQYGFKAVMFVCPAVVDTSAGYWWQVVERAVHAQVAADILGEIGLDDGTAGATITALKRIDDGRRRNLVNDLARRVKNIDGEYAPWDQLRTAEMHAWISEGHTVGNHTWDHPILLACTPDEQRRQVEDAHDWLADHLGEPPVLFAYPNGDWAPTAENRLRELGYRGGFLFDHRINDESSDPLRISRLRIDASADRRRFRAISSGMHSGIFHRVPIG